MTGQLLHGADVVARHQKVGGEAVAQGVGRCRFGQASVAQRLLHGPLHPRLVGVMAAGDAGAGTGRKLPGRKDVLPGPFTVGETR